MKKEGLQLTVAVVNRAWTSHVRITQPNGVWDKQDICENFDHACAMSLVQFQAWVEHMKGLPPEGVKFGDRK